MKTKLVEYLRHLNERIAILDSERTIAEKLGHRAECCVYSARIRDCKNTIDDIKEILN